MEVKHQSKLRNEAAPHTVRKEARREYCTRKESLSIVFLEKL